MAIKKAGVRRDRNTLTSHKSGDKKPAKLKEKTIKYSDKFQGKPKLISIFESIEH